MPCLPHFHFCNAPKVLWAPGAIQRRAEMGALTSGGPNKLRSSLQVGQPSGLETSFWEVFNDRGIPRVLGAHGFWVWFGIFISFTRWSGTPHPELGSSYSNQVWAPSNGANPSLLLVSPSRSKTFLEILKTPSRAWRPDWVHPVALEAAVRTSPCTLAGPGTLSRGCW